MRARICGCLVGRVNKGYRTPDSVGESDKSRHRGRFCSYIERTDLGMNVFARLTIIQGPDQGKELRFSSELITVGRFKNSSLMISDNDLGVSGKHLEIRFKKGNYYLYNYGKNGTLVNGKEIGEGQLNDGDQIGIGFSTLLQFRLEGLTEYQPRRGQGPSS